MLDQMGPFNRIDKMMAERAKKNDIAILSIRTLTKLRLKGSRQKISLQSFNQV